MPTYKSYIIGFILCLILTLGAYFAVTNHSPIALAIIMVVALLQFIAQLVFFLHLGQGTDGHWNLAIFFSTLSIIFIIVAGSLWIMAHLNYNMTPAQINTYMNDQGGGE